MSLSFSNVSKVQAGTVLFSGATFQINPGEKVGLVGPNGAGKTTMFRMITGEDRPDEGQISTSEGLRISYFSQNVGEMAGKTALQEVVEGDAKVAKLKEQLTDFENRLSDPELDIDEMNIILEKMGDVQTSFEKVGGYDLESRAEEVLTGLGISPADHHNPVESFSGGWKMRIALAKVLVTVPDLIVMDEPTNYLDLETILWLENWLQQFKGSIFMTTHDRDFMNNVVKKVVEIAHRKVTVYSGDYDFYEKERDLRRTQLEAEHQRQKDMLAKEEDFIAKFKARASHAAQVQSRVKKLEKIDRVELPPEETLVNFDFPTPPRGSDDVVVMENLAKSWGDKSVFTGLSAMVKRQEKIAVVGVNGAGKSTLLKVICGETDPSGGKVNLGPSIRVGYFSQFALDVLNPESTVTDEVRSRLPNVSDGYLRNLLAAFLFRGDDVKKKVRHLSGGEKSRLVLAYLFSQGNNLLVLDEPTNHLDIITRGVLMDALKKYEGTLLFVSHDRYFLHELGEKVMEVDKGGVILWPGNYAWYLEKKAAAKT